MMHVIREVDGGDLEIAATLHRFNGMAPEMFPDLQLRHLESGYWWLVYFGEDPVAFAGMTPMEPFPNVGYLKRAYVLPDHRGHDLQLRLMITRETKARQIGWTMLVSECGQNNGPSARNFARAGYEVVEPEQRWGAPRSIYWAKRL